MQQDKSYLSSPKGSLKKSEGAFNFDFGGENEDANNSKTGRDQPLDRDMAKIKEEPAEKERKDTLGDLEEFWGQPGKAAEKKA